MSVSKAIVIAIMLSILSLNVKGLISQQKQLCLQQFTENHHNSILFLQETNLSPSTPMVRTIDFKFFLNPPVQPASGVAIAIKKQLLQETKILQHTSLVPGYLQGLHLEVKNHKYHFINVYMPHNAQLASMVINKIQQYLSTTSQDSIVVMSGDWNITLTKEDRKNCSEIRTQLANQIQVLLQQHNLIDVWRNFNPNKLQFTYRGLQSNFPMARLDRVYIKAKDMHLVNSAHIIPSFSDHDGVTMILNTIEKNYKTPYWKFDVELLKSNEYIQIVNNIITYYEQKEQEENSDIAQLWDKLKEEISVASQRFTKKLKNDSQENLKILTSTLNHIDKKEELSTSDHKLLLQIHKEISSVYNKTASHKLNLLESQVRQEANLASKFFLRIAKQSKPSATINELSIDGQIIANKTIIHAEVHKHFLNEFSSQNMPENINSESILYQDIPALSQHDSDKCEEIITQDEIKDSIKCAQLNRAPGLDGLPIEFYKFFWEKIKTLFTKMVQHFQQTGQLPNSMKKIVISPIPKPGDRTNLKNWRPIALINCDYKIISRIYGKRIAAVTPTLLSSDQSYCVPGRTIYNNLHLIRNVIRHANRNKLGLAVLALDQSGAFNKISHNYLEHLLKLHNFGPKLRRSVSALLNETKGFVKIGSLLLAPFLFKTGFRQGDPIAGPLYVLSFEPFLRLAEKMMTPSGIPIPNSNLKVKATAFADDVHFVITDDQDFEKITTAYTIYSQESGAQLNASKSKGLFCGSWKNRNDKPLDCHWTKDGLKILGVFLGNTPLYEEENWATLISKIKGTLNNWSQYVKLTSYIGRKIVCNQLAGSQLIHTLNILHPPAHFFQEVQRAMIDFIWQGKHWLHKNFVHASTDVGGVGLTHLEAKVNSLRLKLIQDIQNNFQSQESVFLYHHFNMSLYGNSTPQHFFMQQKNIIEMANLDNFYASVLKAWHSIEPTIDSTNFSLSVLRDLPLVGSNIVNTEEIKILPEWHNIGITKLGQLLTPQGDWTSLDLHNLSSPTQRRIGNNYIQIKNFFVNKISHEEQSPIHFKFLAQPSKEERLFPGTRKQYYSTSLHFYLKNPEVTGKPTWTDKVINWNAIYKYPTDRRDSDITWRLLHNALVTPRRLNLWKVISTGQCPWCNEEGNTMHMFLQCTQVKPLWNYVSSKIAIINRSTLPNYEQLLVGFPANNPASNLSNFMIVLAKSTIYRSYMNVVKQQNPPIPCYLKLYKRRLNYRLALEEHHSQVTGFYNKYEETFLINNALRRI